MGTTHAPEGVKLINLVKLVILTSQFMYTLSHFKLAFLCSGREEPDHNNKCLAELGELYHLGSEMEQAKVHILLKQMP